MRRTVPFLFLEILSALILSSARAQVDIEQQINIIDQSYAVGVSTFQYSPENNSLGIIQWDGSKYNGESLVFQPVINSGILNAISSSTVYSLTDGAYYTVRARYGCIDESHEYIYAALYSTAGVRCSDEANYSKSIPFTFCDSLFGVRFTLKAARLIVNQSDAAKITDTQTQIEVGNAETLSVDTTATQLTYPKLWLYDSSKLDGTVSTKFGATVWNGESGSYASSACLYTVGGMEVACVSNSTTAVDYPNPVSVSLVSGTTYEVRLKSDSGTAKSVKLANAKVIIDQTAPGGVAKFESYIMFNNTIFGNTGGLTVRGFYLNPFDTSEWNGGTFTGIHEATIKTTAGGSYSAGIYNVAGSTVTGTDSSYTLRRSTDFWSNLTGANTLDVRIKNNAGFATNCSVSWLRISGNLDIPVVLSSPDVDRALRHGQQFINGQKQSFSW